MWVTPEWEIRSSPQHKRRREHTITRVKHNTGSSSRGVERENGLDGHVDSWSAESLEHDLHHSLTIHLRVQRSLSQQHSVVLRGDSQLVVERMVPDLLHVLPVVHNAMLDRVLQRENASLRLSLVTHVAVLLAHPNLKYAGHRTLTYGRSGKLGLARPTMTP